MSEKLKSEPGEQERPLNLNLNIIEQDALFRALRMSLQDGTNREVVCAYKPSSDIVREIDALRNVVTTIIDHTRKNIRPIDALNLGLTNYIPRQQLEEWASMETKGNWGIPIKEKAQFFLMKERAKEQQQKP